MASYKLCKCGSCKRQNLRRYRVRWYDKQGKERMAHQTTAEESKIFLAQVERDLTVGKNNTDITLDEFSQSVPITKGNKASSENMRKVWNKHIKDSIGKIKIREITRADINKWIEEDMMGYSPSTKRKYIGLIDRVMDYAVADKMIEVNPTKLVYIEGDKREREPKPLTTDELFDFIKVWDNDPVLKEHANFVTALAFTGMRPSECSALRWENVDLVKREIKVRQCFRTNSDGSIYLSDELKSKQARRTIAIPEYLLGILQFRKDTHPHEEFVFSSFEGKPILLNNFRRRYWRRALAKAPFKLEVPYDLRHTFSAIMHSTGITVWELSQMMGHADPKTTINWYGNWFDSANHTAVETLDTWAKEGTTRFHISS